jgi:TnpA family transposase
VASSDGQRFGLQASSLLGSLYPRYFGYYDKAVTVYTHVADQHSVFHTQVIACGLREATYVLDGLLHNNTVLRPKEHMVDTHGYTDQLFGLCHLLGYSLMPRLTVSKQTLYKVDRTKHYGRLDEVLQGTGDLALLREQWDHLVRVTASLRNRTAPAHLVLQRLASSAPSDRLAKALTALGRALKSLYLLRYIHDVELRGRVQLQLNRGERRHQLARRLFFANQGAFQIGDYEEIMNKATCLSLLSNAVVVWHTVQMTRIIAQLRAGGENITDEELARISPFAFAHVIPNGTYFVRQAAPDPRRAHPGPMSVVNGGKESDLETGSCYPGALPYIFRRLRLEGQDAVMLRAAPWRHGGAVVVSRGRLHSGHQAPPRPACGWETRQSIAVCPPSPRRSWPRSTAADRRAAQCGTRFPVPPLTVPPCAFASDGARAANRAASILLRSVPGRGLPPVRVVRV